MFQSLLYRSGRVLALAALTLLLGATSAIAQQSRIEGIVRNAQTRDPVRNARVSVVGTELFALTNDNGYYAIDNVAVGTYDVRVQVIGFQSVIFTNQRVQAGLPTTVNFQLQPSILRIEGVVVTGVAEETQAVKLPFTVEQVSGEELPVPAQNPEDALRGKVAGARVVKGSGRPGSGVSVVLRGATSINSSGRTNEPLYVVDGVILGADMVDIDALDIESMEVVKGASAAALYGARAANGVIQIRTKRGSTIPEGETRITLRSELGLNSLANEYRISGKHHYATTGAEWADATGAAAARIDRAVDWVTDSTDFDGDGVYTVHQYAVADNDYPSSSQLFNHQDRFYEPGTEYTNSVTVSHRTGNTNFLASAHETKQGGIIEGLEGYVRRGARVNVDHKIGGAFDFSASGFYSQSVSDDPDNQDGANPFFALPFYPADVDLLQRDSAAQARIDAGVGTARDSNDYLIRPDPFMVEENPVYTARNNDRERVRGRLLGSFSLRYRPSDVFDVDANFSFDRSDRNESQFWFVGFRTVEPATINDGRLRKINEYDQALNGSISATFRQSFGDFGTLWKARALMERSKYESITARATDLVVDNVQDLDNSDADLQRTFGDTEEVRSLGFFVSTQWDYKDKYIFDGLLRRDGSSLFGSGQRWHNYYRLSGAYRLSEESWWPFDFLDEFKLRYSRGTAGGRPRFNAQYETWNVSGGVVSKGNLGNKQLKPETATEDEFGVDMIALGRVSLSVAYARTNIEDQILLVPLAGYNGFSNQWRNAGDLVSKTWEGTLQASVIQTPDVGWNLNFVIDRTRQQITALNVPAYIQSTYFYVRKGEQLGTMYGTRWATQCGEILTAGGFGAACDQFDLNDDGYLVPVGTGNVWTDGIDKNLWGSTITIDGVDYGWGIPVAAQEVRTDTLQSGAVLTDTTEFVRIGSSVPDVNFGIGNTLRWKGFSLYTLFDAQVGGDIYNNTRQWTNRDISGWEMDQVAPDSKLGATAATDPVNHRKSILYLELLYNKNEANSHYVEEGTYVKLREVALKYTFNRGQLEGVLGGFLKRVSLNVIGRNLKTWTGYSGYDPEVSSQGEAAIFRVDEFIYPNFRTWTGSVEIEF